MPELIRLPKDPDDSARFAAQKVLDRLNSIPPASSADG
jgi:hypothetical protein